MFKIDKLKSKCRVHIGGEMTIYDAAELKEKLMGVMEDSRPLELNLSKVTELDSAGVQLLMLVKKEREKQNCSLSLSNHSDEVLNVFELLGLATHFKDPIVMQKSAGENHES